ncbi:MAG TPA: GTPase HflX, partial [Polyangiaceae bacterium]|nr:GTPase HflX [Polyangiaceae bacterium]
VSRELRMPELRPKAVLVAVRLPEVSEAEFDSSRAELRRLVTTLGYDVTAEVTQVRPALSPAAVLGEGKLLELAELTGGSGRNETTAPKRKDKARLRRLAEAEAEDAEDEPELSSDEAGARHDGEAAADAPQLIAVDHDISPSQLRNLERATGVSVLDRTGVIIEIFHRHAKSREARLEVEIARLTYTAPRLRESPRGKERQQGRGAGEAAIELDRRKIRDRIAELREQLEAIQREQAVRRAQRREARRVALVGYTNAGKSSWMRALTGSAVLVENKLFATLDTTIRALQPETRPRILISDTVGFIKKLPHDLVASFRSTLDEALQATLLLHIVDASDPDWESQLEVTSSVLADIGAQGVPSRVVMNKVDLVSDAERTLLEDRFPDAWFVSTKSADDVARLHAQIVETFESSYREVELLVPYDRQRLVSEMHENGRVLGQQYEEAGVRVRWLTDSLTIDRLQAALTA